MNYVNLGTFRTEGVAAVPRDDVVRHARLAARGCSSETDSRPILQRALELGINFFDTADVYSLGVSEEVLGRAVRDFADRATRRRDCDQGVLSADRSPERRRPVAQAHLAGDRRLAAAARDRLRRPVPDSPLRSRHADRGNARSAARRRQGRQGALHRRLEHVRLAVRPHALHAAGARRGRRSCRCRITTT